MPIEKGYRELMDAALNRIRTLTVEEAKQKHSDANVLFVDLRDQSERDAHGVIPGAFHAPRGTIEFWIDPIARRFTKTSKAKSLCSFVPEGCVPH